MTTKLPKAAATLLVLTALTSCLAVRADEPAAVGASVAVSNAYWFRGTPLNTKGVLQGDLATSIPLSSGGALDLAVWANMDLEDDTGDAFEPDGNGAAFTEFDVVAAYSKSYEGYDVGFGLVNYNFPSWPSSGTNTATNEAYASIAFASLGLTHGFTLYYDFDKLEDIYLSYEAGWGTEINETTTFDVGLLVGYMGEDQAATYFGTQESGLSDLSLSGTLSHTYDEATTVSVSAAYVTALDSDLSDALEAAGVDDDGFVVSIGTGWSF